MHPASAVKLTHGSIDNRVSRFCLPAGPVNVRDCSATAHDPSSNKWTMFTQRGVIRYQVTVKLAPDQLIKPDTTGPHRPAPAAVPPTGDANTGEVITRPLPGWRTNGWCLPLPENLVVAHTLRHRSGKTGVIAQSPLFSSTGKCAVSKD